MLNKQLKKYIVKNLLTEDDDSSIDTRLPNQNQEPEKKKNNYSTEKRRAAAYKGQQVLNRIIKSMKDRTVIKIYYDPAPYDGLVGVRDVEFWCVGYNNSGNLVAYGWLRNDYSYTLKSGRPRDAIRWRMFRLDKILKFTKTIQKYDQSIDFVSTNRKKLNILYNKSMKQIIYKVTPK